MTRATPRRPSRFHEIDPLATGDDGANRAPPTVSSRSEGHAVASEGCVFASSDPPLTVEDALLQAELVVRHAYPPCRGMRQNLSFVEDLRGATRWEHHETAPRPVRVSVKVESHRRRRASVWGDYEPIQVDSETANFSN